jgi:hypothetical protein
LGRRYTYVEAVAERCVRHEIGVCCNHVYAYVKVRGLTYSNRVEFDVSRQIKLDVTWHLNVQGADGYVYWDIASVADNQLGGRGQRVD